MSRVVEVPVPLKMLFDEVRRIMINSFEDLAEYVQVRRRKDEVYNASVCDYPALLIWLAQWYISRPRTIEDYYWGKQLLRFAVDIEVIIERFNICKGEKR